MHESQTKQSVPDILDRWQYNRPASPLEAKAFQFINDNPHVVHLLLDLSEQYLQRVGNHWSIAAAFEILRWEHPNLTINGTQQFALSNNHRAVIARIVNRYMGYDFFLTRPNRGRVHLDA